MFRYSRLILLFIGPILFAACETTKPVAPEPHPLVQHVVGYKMSLIDSDGKVTAIHQISKTDLISEDVLNRNLKFKAEDGHIITYHGSWLKEVTN